MSFNAKPYAEKKQIVINLKTMSYIDEEKEMQSFFNMAILLPLIFGET